MQKIYYYAFLLLTLQSESSDEYSVVDKRYIYISLKIFFSSIKFVNTLILPVKYNFHENKH